MTQIFLILLVFSGWLPNAEAHDAGDFFISYAAPEGNLMEDFAEFFAWYIMRTYNRPSYRIRVPGHPELNMSEMIQDNPKLQQKFDFIDQAWKNPTLRVRNGL